MGGGDSKNVLACSEKGSRVAVAVGLYRERGA